MTCPLCYYGFRIRRRIRRCASIGAVLCVAALATCLLPDHSSAQEIQGAAQSRRFVRGTVVDSATLQPMQGVNVMIAGTKLNVFTDAAGKYEIVGFFPASVSLVFREIGYEELTRRTDVSRGSALVNVSLARPVVTIQGITVTGDTAGRFLESRQTTSVMSAEQVEKKRGQTIGETIKELPGVSIIQYGPSIAKPVVRGLHSQRIATVSAGVPLEGQQWGGEHAPEIDAFAANEIEVIRGPGTILYGSGALGGVVRVMPRPLPESGGLSGEISTNSFWNNRQAAGSLLVEGADLKLPFLGMLGWRAQVSARRAGDARTPTYYLPNTGFQEIDYNAALGITRPWGASLLSFSHFDSHLGLYAGAHVGNIDDLERAMLQPFTTAAFAYTLGHPDQKVRHDLLAWHTDIVLPKDSKLEVSYGFQHNNRQEFDSHGFATVGSRPAFALELYTHTLDVKYHHPPLGHFAGTIGFSGMRQGNLSPGRSFLIPQYRLYSGGLFGLEEIALSRLTLTVGARYDDRWQHAYQYGAPVIVSPDEIRSYQGSSGSLGASFKLSDTWSIASTLGLAWRPPNVSERFSQGVHHGTAQYEIGDTSLVPERSLNLDGTLRHFGAHTRLEVSAYRNRLNDYIYLSPRDPVITVRGAYPGYQYAQTNAVLRGFEVTAEATPASWLSLYANANIVRGIDQATATALYDMPADRLTASVRLFAPTSTKFIAPYFEVGTTLVRKQTHVPLVTIYKLPTAGYGLLNFEIGASAVHIGSVHLEPSLTVRNALDNTYRDYLSRYRLFVDEPGRDVVLRLTAPVGGARH